MYKMTSHYHLNADPIGSSKTVTLPFETRKNMECFALSPCGNMLICVDVDGRAILVNTKKRVGFLDEVYTPVLLITHMAAVSSYSTLIKLFKLNLKSNK